ncbi:hypothetical protein DFH29DRAFT_997405 [Suillus ampliporus]|nr:hypothetical protein DFH29DRAFT_997405 [Suillus ampliporus]
MDMALPGPTPFRCACTREFTQESAYTKHQRSCMRGKKRVFSALSRAKDLLSSVKWTRVDNHNGRSSGTQSHNLLPSFDKVNEPLHPEFNVDRPGTPLTMYLPQEVSHAVLSHNALISACDTILGTASMQIDEEGLSLAQRRSRHIGAPMPVRYRQYDDVLPQPPLSVPSSQTQQPEFNPPVNSTDTSIRAQTSSWAPPFRTVRNVFGLVRQFFTSTSPSHDPEEVVTLLDISSVPVASPADIPTELSDMSFHPYPNQSSFELGHWYWNGSVQKSQQSFKELVDIVRCPDYDPDDVRNTPWDKINLQLGASIDVEGRDEWEDEDAGWRKTQVTIEVPFSHTAPQPDV